MNYKSSNHKSNSLFGFLLFVLLIFVAKASWGQENHAPFCDEMNIQQISGHGRAFAMSLSPSASHLAVANQTGISVYDTGTLEELYSLNDNSLPELGGLALDWSSTGNQIATYISPELGIQIWNVASGELEETLRIDTNYEYNDQSLGFSTLLWSPDSAYLAGIGGLPLTIWDIDEEIIVFETEAEVAHDYGIGYEDTLHSLITWSPDGVYIAIPDSNKIRIWDSRTWDEVQTLTTSIGRIYSLDWSAGGVLAVSGNSFAVERWDTISWQALEAIDIDNEPLQSIYSIKWSPDSRLLAIGRGNILIWDAESEQIISEMSSQETLVYDLEWLNSFEQLISRNRNGDIYFWDIPNSCISKVITSTTEPRQAQ